MIRESTKELAKRGKEITIEEWNNTPLNTHERYYLMEYLSNETYISICKTYNNNTSHVHNPTTYDEAVTNLLFPELIKRFELMQKVINKTIEQIQIGPFNPVMHSESKYNNE